MAIALRGVSAGITPLTAAGVIPAVHASAAAGDLSVLFLTGKPFSTSGMAFTGWVPLTGILTAGSVANSADLGSPFAAVWVKESAPTGAVTAPTMTGFDTAQACIVTFSKAATEVWDYSAFTSGVKALGAGYACTGGALITASGDMVVAMSGINSDLSTPSVPTITGMSGSTIGTVVSDQLAINSQGFDCAMGVAHAPITAGSSAAAPVAGFTYASSNTGMTVFLRLRVGQLVTPGPIWHGQAIESALW